jgi:hypothetical protein
MGGEAETTANFDRVDRWLWAANPSHAQQAASSPTATEKYVQGNKEIGSLQPYTYVHSSNTPLVTGYRPGAGLSRVPYDHVVAGTAS